MSRRALLLSFLAFLSLGLPDGSLGVAWPGLRASLGVELGALGTLLAASIAGTLVSSALSGALLGRLGVGRVLALSTLLVAASALVLAASTRWPWALAGALVGGLGAGAVDAGVNAYAAASFSPRVMSWLHAIYGAGAMLGPLVMTAALAGPGWRAGYAALAVLLGALSAVFAMNLTLWTARPRRDTQPRVAPPPASRLPERALATPPRLALGLALFFVYTGLEATCGHWGYSFLTEAGRLGTGAAGLAVAGYWGALGVGRVVFGALTARVTAPRLVRAGALLALASGLVVATAPGPWGAAALVALGFALAPIYPLSMSLTPRRVGTARAARVVGWQVGAAYLGVAAWPLLGGLLAERFGIRVLGAYLAVLALLVVLLSGALHAEAGPRPTSGAHT